MPRTTRTPSRTGRSRSSRHELLENVPESDPLLGLSSVMNALSLEGPRAGTRLPSRRESLHEERQPSRQAFEAWLQQERTRRRGPLFVIERQEVWLRIPLRAPSTGSTTSSTREPTPDNTPRTSTQEDYEDFLELASLQDPSTLGRPSMSMTCIGEEMEEEALEEVD